MTVSARGPSLNLWGTQTNCLPKYFEIERNDKWWKLDSLSLAKFQLPRYLSGMVKLALLTIMVHKKKNLPEWKEENEKIILIWKEELYSRFGEVTRRYLNYHLLQHQQTDLCLILMWKISINYTNTIFKRQPLRNSLPCKSGILKITTVCYYAPLLTNLPFS